MFRLLQNGEMVQELPGQQIREDGTVRHVCTEWQPQPCAPGDELAVTFTCTDDFGLTYANSRYMAGASAFAALSETETTSTLRLRWPKESHAR